MAKFSQAFLQSMTQPAYQEGLFTAARSLGGLPGRIREEQETRATQESLVNMMNTNSRIAETGNVKGLEDQRVRLTEMLSAAQSDQSRDMILQELSRVEGLRDVAKPAAQQRDINTLLRAEQSLAEADQQIATLQGDASAEGQIKLDAAIRAKQAIQSRVNSLKSNASLVAAADNQKIDMEIASLTKNEALRSARKNEMLAELRSVTPNSEAWDALVKRAEDQGLGQSVKTAISEIQDAELKRIEVLDAQASRRPLNEKEKKELNDAKISVSGASDFEARRIYTVFANAQIKKKVDLATRPLDVPTEARANALVKTALNFMVRDAELEGMPFMQDLSDKVEDLLADPNQLQEIQGLVSGLKGVEVVEAVESYIQEKFPKKYAEYQQAKQNRQFEAEEFQDLLDDVYSKDSSLNPNDPTGVDQEIARIRAERELRNAVVRAGKPSIEYERKGRRGGPT